MIKEKHYFSRGVTLIELLIGIAILAILAFSIYRGLSVLLDILSGSTTRLAATTLANEEIEIIRNIAYNKVGVVGGIPVGILPSVHTKIKDKVTFNVTTVVRNIDDSFDGTLGGNPNDLSPADYKLVELTLDCTTCVPKETFQFTARVAPRALETASTNGALFVRVIDASGEPVEGATVQITNISIQPTVNITDTTDVDGYLKIVDVPPAVQSYHIVANKTGYSSDQTYATSTANPNPIKLNATVALQTVTQITFSIDQVSDLAVTSVTEMCAQVPSIDFTVRGSKLIGTSPDVLKYQANHVTDGFGSKTVSNLEWDTYSIEATDPNFELAGTIPNPPLILLPNAQQTYRMVMQPQNPRSILVTVVDATNDLPIPNARVSVSNNISQFIKTTGRGFLAQTDWSGGAGQNIFTQPDQYFEQDGNIDDAMNPGEISLIQTVPGTHALAGWLVSSIFNAGSPSNFYNITWEPQDQPPETGVDSLKFQIATATTTNPLTWDFKGPDGTSGTFYTTSVSSINQIHNGDQYIRYKAYLGTASTTFSPNVSDVAITFASDCVPPGQAFFQGLNFDTYTVDVSANGYVLFNGVTTTNFNWQEYRILLNPIP